MHSSNTNRSNKLTTVTDNGQTRPADDIHKYIHVYTNRD